MLVSMLGKRLVMLGVCFYFILGLMMPVAALGCEGIQEEAAGEAQKWSVRSAEFHENPKVEQKHQVTIELKAGGPEKITKIKVGKPADFSILKLNGCEREYKVGDGGCAIEMEFLTPKANGTYFANLELIFAAVPKLTFDKIPVGTIP